jgi:hypothetical protein
VRLRGHAVRQEILPRWASVDKIIKVINKALIATLSYKVERQQHRLPSLLAPHGARATIPQIAIKIARNISTSFLQAI